MKCLCTVAFDALSQVLFTAFSEFVDMTLRMGLGPRNFGSKTPKFLGGFFPDSLSFVDTTSSGPNGPTGSQPGSQASSPKALDVINKTMIRSKGPARSIHSRTDRFVDLHAMCVTNPVWFVDCGEKLVGPLERFNGLPSALYEGMVI